MQGQIKREELALKHRELELREIEIGAAINNQAATAAGRL